MESILSRGGLKMGTNYYAKFNECKHCGRYNQIHIGKMSMGWEFSFQAHRERDEDEDMPYHPGLKSIEAWREFLKDKTIRDGQCRPDLTPDEFWKMVENSKGYKNNTTEVMREFKEGKPSIFLTKEVVDDYFYSEGFSFCYMNFS